ncbi:MAG: gliding motility-associated C-terminal domain-containing protein [Flavobacteriales bacterium]
MKKNIYIKLLFITLLLFSQSLIAANKYWIGNGGNWSDNSHWSLTSGGTGGAALPTEFDIAVFDNNSFSISSQTVLIDKNIAITSMDWQKVGNSPILMGTTNHKITCYGYIFLNKEMSNNFLGELEFVFGDYPQASNFFFHDFTGKVNYSYEPKNILVQKIEKNYTTSPLAVTVSVGTTDETCPGNCDGTATVTVLGSAGPFTYTYFPIGPYVGEPSNIITSLCAKAYTVVVKDLSSGTNYPKNFNISSNPPITIIPQSTVDNTCYQSCDGQINLLTFGGSGTLHYLWSDGQTTESALNLCAGIYTLDITDDAGCTESLTDTIEEPAILSGTISSQTNLLCNSVCDGAASVSVTGGTPGYSYSWYDAGGGITNSISNQCADTIHLKITDSHACLDTVEVIITEPTIITLSANTTQNLLCANACIGTVTYSGLGGTAPLSYSWYDAPGTPTASVVNSLCAGTYHVAVVDGNGCKDTASTVVTTPTALTASIVDSTNVMCRGLCTGDATVRATGGTSPYTYNWYNLVGMTDTLATGICAGASNVQVTDGNGCKDTAQVVITQPATTLFANIVDQSNNICSYDCNGDATVRVSGGTSPYAYNWYDAPNLETDTVANNLCTQDYHVEIIDGNGCKDTITASILSPAPLDGSMSDSIPLTCLGTCIGSLTVTGSGGTPGYTYNWLNPAVPGSNIVSNLCAGTYDVEISDANGCLDTVSYSLLAPPGVTASISSSTNNLCFGKCTGSTTVAGSGGIPPYTYSWYDAAGQTTATASNLCNGTYHVAIEDNAGCRDTTSITITSPTAITTSTTDVDVACLGLCNGSSTAVPSGGTSPYSYFWYTTGHVTATRTNLCAGNYPVEIADINGCKDTAIATIIAPAVVITTIDTNSSPSCFGVCDAMANVHATGGTTPYIYNWTSAGNQSDSTAINLCSGLQTVVVTDANGCIGNASINISQPNILVASIVDQSNNICSYDCNGDATVRVSGGTSPYAYNWYDAPNLETDTVANNLCTQDYHVEIIDGNGCKDTITASILSPAPLDGSMSDSIPLTCLGTCIGSLTVTGSGGTPGYTYNWLNPAVPGSNIVSNLCAGTYDVEISDANGCLDTVSYSLLAPPGVTASISSSTNNLCFGKCTGSTTVAGSGGIPPYTYSWYDAAGQTTATASNLCNGTYHVAIEDNAGCRDTTSITITSPTAITTSTTDVDVACLGLCNGSSTAVPSGGTSPYSYFWYTTGHVTATRTNLCAGNYPVEIADINGCKDTAIATIIAPAVVITTIDTNSSPSCFGVCDAMANVHATGGTTPYIYNWTSAGNQSDSTAINLCSGLQTVVVTDANGCIGNASINISQPNILVASIADSNNISCNGLSDGDATVSASGGTSPYTYLWTDVPGNPTTAFVSGLSVGLYHVQVSDTNGCNTTVSVNITQPSALSAFINTISPSCNGSCNGSMNASATTGGTAPYTYLWYDAANQTTAQINGLCASTHNVEVTDANGCVDSAVATLTEPTLLIATMIDSNQATCAGICDGDATVSAAGGTIPYTYNWFTAGNQNTALATNLCFGINEVEVTDTNGCKDTVQVNITAPVVVVATIIDSTVTACSNVCIGSAEVSAIGGTGPYTYNWFTSGNQSTVIAISLCFGTQRVQVTDANGCVDTTQVMIGLSGTPLVGSIVDSSATSCANVCTGTAEVSAAGGNAPYSFNWFTASNQTTAIATSLCSGIQSVEITDGDGCVDTTTVQINLSNSQMAISMVHSTSNLCNGSCDGTATTSVSGGNAPYTFDWFTAGNQTDTLAINLCAGVNEVKVTDADGCIDTAQVFINQPTRVSGSGTSTNPNCNGECNGTATMVPAGGAGGYTHHWNTGSSISSIINLCAGTYTDTITDANGCKDTAMVIINDPVVLQANPTSTRVSCFGDANGTVSSIPSGGTGSYTYQWNDTGNSTTSSVSGLNAGVYQIIVSDSLGCLDTSSVTVNSPTQLNASITDTNYTVCVCNGSATVTASGGTAPYTYLWNDLLAQTTTQASNLCVGNYSVIVTDSSLCKDTIDIAILDTSTSFKAVTVDSIAVTCFADCDGSATVRGVNGTNPYTYLWNDPMAQTDSIAINLCAGTYIAQVTDSNNCVRITHATINTRPIVDGTVSVVQPLCNGDCNGIATVVASGGDGGPYTHSWSTISNNDSIFNVCAGNYYDTITDASGCSAIIAVVVGEPTQLNASPLKTDISCFGLTDGFIDANASGGTTPYTYLWDDVAASTTATISGLGAGTYNVVVTDSNGCTYIESATILEPSQLTSSISDSNNVHCNCIGFANISGNGGTLPYTFSWNDPSSQTDSTAVNLCAGFYTGTITDASGCISTSMVSIVDTSGFSASISDTNHLVCYGVCIGSATISAVGGKTPYTFSWNDPATQTDSTAINLCAGSYIGSVTDSLGCPFVLPITINQPDSIHLNISRQNVSCLGFCDGEIVSMTSGGTGSTYTYLWNDPLNQTTAMADSLCAGSYTVIVTDSMGCTNTTTRNITEPTQLIAFISSYNDVQCTGLCNGSINSIAVGGTTPYSYTWNNLANTQNVSGLCADTFYVTVTDANSCVDSASQIIVEPLLALTSSIVDSTNLLCRSVCDGIATVRASGGTAGYNYNWYTAGNLNDTTGVNLCAGLNFVEVTDTKGCIDTAQVNLFAPPSIFISTANHKNISCYNACDGAADISISGGVSPYTIQWNDPSLSTDTFVVNLCAGTYKAIVRDANGCVDSIQITITEPSQLSASISNQTNIFCQSYCDGNATVRVTGGTAPYNILWPNAGNQTDSIAINLCAQTYTYQITDTNNCVFTDSVTILNTGLLATIAQTNVTCFGLCDGAVTISHTGGLAPFTHSWTTGSIDSTLTNLCAGNYQDTLGDGSGCISVIDVIITVPNQLTASIDSTNITCNGLCDGVMTGQANGGSSPYSFRWITGNISQQTINNLCAGTYEIEVTDASGCKDTSSALIAEPAVISIALSSKTDANCFAQCDGQAVVLATGGTGSFTYDWNGGQTGASVNNLCAGNDTVTATDSNGCSAQLIVPILEPADIQISFSDTVHLLCSTVCDGEIRAEVVGGTGAYTYLWNDPSTQSTDLAVGLCAGTYQVLVEDAKGCKDSSSFNVNSLGAFSVNITYTNPKCFGDCNGEVRAVLTGGVKPYLGVNWGGPGNAAGKTTLIVKNLCQGNYFVTATDSNNCVASDAQQLTNPPLLTLTTDSTNLTCFGICDGTTTVIPNGGTAPYSYNWNDPNTQTTAQATNLCDGEWKVIVLDANGCTKADSTIISEPAQIISNNTITPAECSNTFDGSISETASGGTGTLNYAWSGPSSYSSTLEDLNNILPGRYILTLTDANNCTLIDTADVNANTIINAFAGSDTAICNGQTIILNGSGGLTYLWSNNETTPSITITPNNNTTYKLYVTSGTCKDTATVVVTVEEQPIASVTMDAYLVLEGKSTTLHGSGAGAGGTYDWTPPTTLNDPTVQDPIATPTSTTTYLLTVTNPSGCSDTASATLKTAKDITFPNGITPNGDGRNDRWVIDLIEQFPQCQVEIYNRWGQLLFQSPGYVQQWDGTFDGKPLPVGTYYYIIDLGPGLKKFTGPITLMR